MQCWLIPWARPLCAWILHRSELKVENATAKAVKTNKKSRNRKKRGMASGVCTVLPTYIHIHTEMNQALACSTAWIKITHGARLAAGWDGNSSHDGVQNFSHSRVVGMTVVKQRGERRACAHFCGRMEVHPCFLKYQWEESAARLQQLVVICCRRVFGSEEHHSTDLISPKKSTRIVQ